MADPTEPAEDENVEQSPADEAEESGAGYGNHGDGGQQR